MLSFLQVCMKIYGHYNPLDPLRGFDTDSIVMEIKYELPANKGTQNTSSLLNANTCSWTCAERE